MTEVLWTCENSQTNLHRVCDRKECFSNKFCLYSRVTSLEELQGLILLEDFKNCVPANIVVYLNEQKVTSFAKADEFVLKHKNFFSSGVTVKTQVGNAENSVQHPTRSFKGEMTRKSNGGVDKRVCFFCINPNNLIADCKAWKQKSGTSKTKNVALFESVLSSSLFV